MRLIDGDALKQTFCAECTHTLKCSDCDIDYHFEKLAPTIHQWIPCSEKLPEERDHYICTCKDGYRTIVTYVKWQNKFKRWDLTGARSYWKVIAWMPLPEPYKEDEQCP